MGTTGSASDGIGAAVTTYATLAQLRNVSHYSSADVPDPKVNSLISEADRAILCLATIEVYDESLKGDIDSSNKIFTTQHKPIADTDFDKDIDKDDVTVYLVDYDEEENPVSTETEVATVNARDGIITLSTAPTTTNAEVGVHIDYRYYKSPVDFDMLILAANYYLAYLCEMKIQGKQSEDFSLSDPESIRAFKGKILSAKSHWLSLALAQLHFARPSMHIT